jgi:hypothetical protein
MMIQMITGCLLVSHQPVEECVIPIMELSGMDWIYLPYILAYKLMFWELHFGPELYVRLLGMF